LANTLKISFKDLEISKKMSTISFSIGNEVVVLPAKVFHTLVAVHDAGLPSFKFSSTIGNKSDRVKYMFECFAGSNYDDSEGGESSSETAQDEDNGEHEDEEAPYAVLTVDGEVKEFDYDDFWDSITKKKVSERKKITWRTFDLEDMDSKVVLSRGVRDIIIKGEMKKARGTWLDVEDNNGGSLISMELTQKSIQDFTENRFGVFIDPSLIEVIKVFVF
jgi:hypothetical protein